MKTSLIKAVLFTVLAQSTLVHAIPSCPTHQAVQRDSWTKLRDVLPSPDQLLEASYEGEGLTSKTDYRLHLIQYMNTRDEFVAVMENPEKQTGAIGIIKRQVPGTYLWYGVKVSGGEETQLEPVFDHAPLFRFTVNYDRKGRTANVDAVSNDPAAGVEMVRFSKARTTLLRRAPVKGVYLAERGNGNSIRLTVTSGAEDSPTPGGPSDCSDPGVIPAQQGSSWNVQFARLQDDQGSSAQDSLARHELPGVLALRGTRYEGYVAHPSNTVGAAVVSIFVPRFLLSDREKLLYFDVDANGFLSSNPMTALVVD